MTGPTDTAGHTRLDAVAKVTGAARFTVDVLVPGGGRGVLAARMVRSPYPHARIEAIDPRGALALPGAVAVFTGEEVSPLPPSGRAEGGATGQSGAAGSGGGPGGAGEVVGRLLAVERVRYVGEPVAVVVATDEATTREMAQQVEVRYRPLGAVLSIEEALAPGAPAVHDTGNLAARWQQEVGAPDAAMAGAQEVFEDEFVFPATFHYAMEPHAVVVRPAGGPSRRGLEVWTSSRNAYGVRQAIARWCGLPESRVRVHLPYVGGAYGSKSYAHLELLAAWLALRLGRAVRLVTDLAEGFATATGHRVRVRLKTGLDGQHRMVARHVQVWVDVGAYADRGPLGPGVCRSFGYRAAGPYRLPNLRVEAWSVYTHRVPGSALRGYGGPQVSWAYEAHLDHMARAIGEDPVSFRRRHLLQAGEPYPLGGHPMDADLPAAITLAMETLKAATAGPGQDSADTPEPAPPAGIWRRGRGVAVGIKDSGGNRRVALALVRLHADATATVSVSAAETGQGSGNVVARIAAAELGLSPDRVRVAPVDTLAAPFDQSTGSSATTSVTGQAVAGAARSVARQLLEAAAARMGVPPTALRLDGGQVIGPAGSLPYDEVVTGLFGMPGGELVGVGHVNRPPASDRQALYWEAGVGAAEVEVDSETFAVRVRRYVTVSDIGRALQPLQVEGQEEGAAMLGMSQALLEELGDEAATAGANLVDYPVVTFEHLPQALLARSLERGDGPGPMGAKGVGESGALPVAPALAQAVGAALGVSAVQLPLRPGRLFAAARAAGLVARTTDTKRTERDDNARVPDVHPNG